MKLLRSDIKYIVLGLFLVEYMSKRISRLSHCLIYVLHNILESGLYFSLCTLFV